MNTLLSKSCIRKYEYIFFFIIFAFVSVFYYGQPKCRAYDVDITAKYLNKLDIGGLYLKGADWLNPIYSPERIGLSPNTTYVNEYDFQKLELTEKKLAKVDRHQALKEIFKRITDGAFDERHKHLALLRFLQHVSLNGKLQPMYPDGQTVFDPLVLLELTEMRCGHVARIGVDLWVAGGGKGRIVQLGHHVSAEIYYDEGWHLLEGDVWENGVVINNQDRNIPSLESLSIDPYKIDASPPQYWSPISAQLNSIPYLSAYFFNANAYGKDGQLQYLYKTATTEQERHSKWYGWNHYAIQTITAIKLLDEAFHYQPSAVTINSISRQKDLFTIQWAPSLDRDRDLLGYRLFVSKNSRGWAYQRTKSPEKARPYILLGWKPTMYDKVNRLPPSDIGVIETTNSYAIIAVPAGKERYITIMPFDAHGESSGRQIYYLSDEVKLSHSVIDQQEGIQ